MDFLLLPTVAAEDPYLRNMQLFLVALTLELAAEGLLKAGHIKLAGLAGPSQGIA